MTTVLASTDALPELEAALERRRSMGLDTYDEWWEGVYRIVAGPTPEHGQIQFRLAGFLDRLRAGTNLRVSTPLNIGIDKQDARVPDIGVFSENTERTSPAFLSTAALVVEILSSNEKAGAKLDFFARWGVEEYLEIDVPNRTLRLLTHTDDQWVERRTSQTLPFNLTADGLVGRDAHAHDSYDIDWPA